MDLVGSHGRCTRPLIADCGGVARSQGTRYMKQNSRLVLQTLDTFGAAGAMEEGREGDDDEEVAAEEVAAEEGEEAGAGEASKVASTVDRADCPLAVRTIHMSFLSAMVRGLRLPHSLVLREHAVLDS